MSSALRDIGSVHVLTDHSTKMYKSRIKEWGLRKNLNADEKRKLAAAIKCDTANGRSFHSIDVDSIPLTRIRRFCRHDEKFWGLVNKISTGRGSSRPLLSGPRRHSFPEQNGSPQAQGSTSCTLHREQSTGTGSISSPPPPERPLSVESALLRVETLLLHARRWTQWQIELEERCSPLSADARLCLRDSPHSSTTNEAQAELNTLLSNFEHGAELLARGEMKVGWKAIHDGCDLLAGALSQQSTDLLRILLKILSEAQWAHFPELRKLVFRFFAKMSAKQLGVSNPLTVVLFHLLDEEVLSVAVRPLLEVLIDLQSAVDLENWRLAALKRNLVTFLTYHVNDLVTAEALGISNVQHCELVWGCDHRRTRRCILQLGAIYHAKRQYREAFERYKDVIDRDEICDGQTLDWISITACRSLANVYESQGDMQASESCWRVALSNTEIKYGMETAASKSLIAKSKEAFGRQGKDSELWPAARISLDSSRRQGPDCLDRFMRVRSVQSGRWMWCQGDDPERVWDAEGSCHSTMRLAGVSPAIFTERPEENTNSAVVSGCELLHHFNPCH